jgi:hypothetical protein
VWLVEGVIDVDALRVPVTQALTEGLREADSVLLWLGLRVTEVHTLTETVVEGLGVTEIEAVRLGLRLGVALLL